MSKVFNVNANCKPNMHYMVNIESKLKEIREMVDRGQYFTINRARQYGKTTTLRALTRFLEKDYVVISLDFQLLSNEKFANESVFVKAFTRQILDRIINRDEIPELILTRLQAFAEGEVVDDSLPELFRFLSEWCGKSPKPVVLIVDEVDQPANNQVFLDFLAQLRGYYIDSDLRPTFHSVILAGVHDVRNIKLKIRPDSEHKRNSPWNIAADFTVDMSFSTQEIAGMLEDYEKDHHTGMNTVEIAGLLYDYTSGYPVLVSGLCKLMDEEVAGQAAFPDKKDAWSRAGFLEAVKMLLEKKNVLLESLIGKLENYPELKDILYLLLFQGRRIPYSPDNSTTDMALMFGLVKVEKGSVVVANRIFETRLYNMFLTMTDLQSDAIYKSSEKDRNQFIQDGRLNMRLVLEKFVIHFTELYGERDEKFLEEDGRRYFLLYMNPIINGTGNYYVEAQTRNMERTDVIVDYNGEQFVIELKIWRGDAYHTRGEEQLKNYLDYYRLQKGYMLSFNFNKNKVIGVGEINLGDKVLVEAVV